MFTSEKLEISTKYQNKFLRIFRKRKKIKEAGGSGTNKIDLSKLDADELEIITVKLSDLDWLDDIEQYEIVKRETFSSLK